METLQAGGRQRLEEILQLSSCGSQRQQSQTLTVKIDLRLVEKTARPVLFLLTKFAALVVKAKDFVKVTLAVVLSLEVLFMVLFHGTFHVDKVCLMSMTVFQATEPGLARSLGCKI